jgi:hypothetical protein
MDEFIRQLLEASQRRAGSLNFRIGFQAQQELETLIRNGVNRMTPDDLRSPERRRLAEANLMQLIDLMGQDARQRSLTESFDQKSFANAVSNFCPRWPFC